jgi:hypothetical protein
MAKRFGKNADLAKELGGVSATYVCAVKKKAGIRTRVFDINRALKFLEENPDFKVRDAYKMEEKKAAA